MTQLIAAIAGAAGRITRQTCSAAGKVMLVSEECMLPSFWYYCACTQQAGCSQAALPASQSPRQHAGAIAWLSSWYMPVKVLQLKCSDATVKQGQGHLQINSQL
jgi:hypothetical protein